MAQKPKILVFAGSLRKDSYNKKLAKIAVEGVGAAGGDATYIDLRDYPLPIFDQDFEKEEGMPENGKKLKKLFLDHQGLLICSPEYNSSIPGVLKNVIDWVSRVESKEEPDLAAYSGKVAAIMSASPSALGGLRGLVTLRSILGNIRVLVLPDQISIVKAHEAFNPDESLKDEKQKLRVYAISGKLVQTIEKLNREAIK